MKPLATFKNTEPTQTALVVRAHKPRWMPQFIWTRLVINRIEITRHETQNFEVPFR